MTKRSVILWAIVIFIAVSSQAGFIPRASHDPDFFSPGKDRGYYMVTSDSRRWWQWGLGRAPVVEPSPWMDGFGDDAIAIPFDAKGRVAFAPVYIYTIRPESWQTNRLDSVILGKTSQAEIRLTFGRPDIRGSAGGYTVWFYQIKVYNPFEEWPDLH